MGRQILSMQFECREVPAVGHLLGKIRNIHSPIPAGRGWPMSVATAAIKNGAPAWSANGICWGKEMNWIATAATAEDYKAGLYHFPVGFIFQERIDYFLPVYNISY